MKRLLNTLYVMTEDAYASLENDNVVLSVKGKKIGQYPLQTLERIVLFTNAGASSYLLGACVERGIDICLHDPNGRFLARATGMPHGNVLLRRKQFRWADDPEKSLSIASPMILGKIYNGRWSIERTLRDHKMVVNAERLETVSDYLRGVFDSVRDAKDISQLRGIEGKAAVAYFSGFDDLIIVDKESFKFEKRTRRPPTDNVNALLSFAYTLLANDCAQALASVGLDPYVGFMHEDRPGRYSLALDLMEELRPILGDRFVITLINNRVISKKDFTYQESGAVLLSKDGRKKFLTAWQEKKKSELTHPYLQEKIPWGMVPYAQAQLLAKYIRGDIDGYPPFLWK